MCLQDTTAARYAVPGALTLTGRYISNVEHIAALPELDTHELAWAAGFFDGEGCTYLGRHGNQGLAAPCVEVNQLHPDVLLRFQHAVGGLGSMRLRPDKKKKRPNPMWSFYTRSWRPTQAVLTLLWPYLGGVKRAQAARIFAQYQEFAVANPRVGQPNMSHLWTETACPRGHTDIEFRSTKTGYVSRRCRVCRREKTRIGYSTLP